MSRLWWKSWSCRNKKTACGGKHKAQKIRRSASFADPDSGMADEALPRILFFMRGEIGVVHLSVFRIQEKCDRNVDVFIKSHKFYKLFLNFSQKSISIAYSYGGPSKMCT